MSHRKRPLSQLHLENYLRKKKVKSNGDNSVCDNGDNSVCNDSGFKKQAGTIRRIVLKNFMCHASLEVHLESNINFIIGRNGSGKSAILTGLVVGLGAKASVTNRGTNIKNFIKEGKNLASVEITLNNTSYMAYRASTYGSAITIQRSFNAAGSSSYKIKSATGEVISTSSKEIQRITSALNIQVDNPVCILNQDTARNFLSTGDPKQRFILFMRATRLDVLLDEYQKTVESKRTSIQLYKEKEKIYNTLKERLNELKKNIENHRSIIKIKDKLTLNQKELLWAKVRDLEDELNGLESQVEKLQKKHEEMSDNITNKVQKLQEIKDRVSELNQQIMELKESAELENRSQEDVRKVITELAQEYNNKRREKHAVQSAIETRAKDREALQSQIENFTSNMNQYEQEKLKRLQEMTELQKQIKIIHDVMETTRNDLFQMKSSDSRSEDVEQDLQRELDQNNKEQSKTRENLAALQSKSNNNLLVYGGVMSEIIATINELKHRFIQMPRGPLGALINIRDKKWALAVESFLGALLKSFTVDNRKDNEVLMEIFRKYQQRQGWKQPTVITSKFFFEVHDISKNAVRSPLDCIGMFDSLDIADPVVANCLIDQVGIENILLIPSTERAIELMSNATEVPKNCKQAITVTGDKYYPYPNYKMYASRYKQVQYLQVNTADLISQYKEKLQDLQQKSQAVESQLSALHSERLEHEAKTTETITKLNKLKQAYSVANRKLDEQKLMAAPEIGSINSLETELTEVKRVLEQKQADLEQIESSMKSVKENITENESRLKKLQEIGRGLEERIAPLEQQIMEQGAKKNDLSVSESFDKRKLAECAKRLEETRSALEEKQRIIDEQAQEAGTVGDRPEEIRQVPEIVNNINEMQRTIRKLESTMEHPEETRRMYEEVNSKYQQASELMLTLHNDVEKLKQGITSRNRHYKCTEDYFITLLNHNFEKVLEFRQFKGNLKVDVEKKKLDLVVIPQQGSQGCTATTNLSGGEKSFSTVAFLYSLWQCMDFPFYFLDEFDVYMDTVNRMKAMEILIHHAKSRPDLQFVFLTPQDVSCINDESVIIHKLDDPEHKAVH